MSLASSRQSVTISPVRDKGSRFSQTKRMIIASIFATLPREGTFKEL